jgi:hypothetical protein
MASKNKKANTADSTEAGNINKTGGSYKEKQPAAKPRPGKEAELPIDEDGDAKSEHSINQRQRKTKTSI